MIPRPAVINGRLLAERLRAKPGGLFVIECLVPDLARFDHDQRVRARSVT